MVYRLLLILACLLPFTRSHGQGVSKEWADSLLRSLDERSSPAARLHVYFMAAQYYIFKAGEQQVDLDMAREYMRKAALLNQQVHSKDADGFLVLLQSFLAREQGRREEGKTLTLQAIRILQEGSNKYYLGTAWFNLSDYYDYRKPDEMSEKKRFVSLAIEAFKQAGYVEQQAYGLKFLADLYALDDQRDKALEILNLSLQLYRSFNYRDLQGVYILFSNIYFTDGNYKQALNYGILALKCAQKAGDTSMSLCQIDNYVGTTLMRLKEPGSALVYYKNGLAVAQNLKENNAVLELLANIVSAYVAMRQPDSALDFVRSVPGKYLRPMADDAYIYLPHSYVLIYAEKKDDASVQRYCDQILQQIKIHRPGDKDLHDFYMQLIAWYLRSGQTARAGEYIALVEPLSRKINDPHRIGETFFLKFQLDTAQGRYQSAVQDLLRFKASEDSLFTETSNRQIRQLEMEYETEKNKSELKLRDQNIKMLSQQNQLQTSRLNSANLTRNITIGGIISLIIIVLLLYWQYRHKQQTNLVITQKNGQLERLLSEKEWLVKEIHHRVKNNFHVVASLLEIQTNYLKNPEALSAVRESQHRIHSMSIIHQKLYQSEGLSTIHMPEYVYELVEYLKESYAIHNNIGFQLHIENISLDHPLAISIGLILNEAITNSIKYAFPQNQEGKIYISLTRTDPSLAHAEAPLTGNEGPLTGTEPPTTGSERTTTGSERIPTGSERSPTGREHSPTGREHPIAGSERSPTGREHPIAGSERPTTGTEPPIAGTERSLVWLKIADNGRGLPEGWDKKLHASMGMELLQGLTEDMGGQINIGNNNGTQIDISFKYDA